MLQRIDRNAGLELLLETAHFPTNLASPLGQCHHETRDATSRTVIATTIRRLRRFGGSGGEVIREGGENAGWTIFEGFAADCVDGVDSNWTLVGKRFEPGPITITPPIGIRPQLIFFVVAEETTSN